MFEGMSGKLKHGRDVFSEMSPGKKIAVLGGVAALSAILIVFLIWANKPDYSVLYSDLNQQDAGAIVEKLNDRKIPYKISGDGQIIEVPKKQVQETRLALAQEGLPLGGTIGYELFNETKIGETQFQQGLNLQRALEGELARTIKEFDEVEKVRVHLNVPKQRVFMEEDRPPSASVVLSLKRGQSLDKSQLQGIVNLVAAAVEGLTPENISVVDTSGGLLYSKDQEAEGALSAAQAEYKHRLERTLANKIRAMVERVVGPEKVVAQVTTDLNYESMSTNEEIFDPDRTSIRSEQRLKEINQGPARDASGIPQTSFELGTGNQDQGKGDQGELYQRTEDTTNYEITRITRQINTPAGDIRRLSVAVMVDKAYIDTIADGIKSLEELVKNAVGFDETRGDTVVVRTVPFYLPEEEPVTLIDKILALLERHLGLLVSTFLITLFFLIFGVPVMRMLTRRPESEAQETPEALPEGEEAPEALPDYGADVRPIDRDQALQLARQDPEKTINLLRSWIEEEVADADRTKKAAAGRL
jgi:flagellar M-ring protein FliF